MKTSSLQSVSDIPSQYLNTPVEKLIRYHNWQESYATYDYPEILVAKCMDYRVQLSLPSRFAYKLRTGGCNLCHNDFQVAYAVAVGGVKAIALISHTDCGMVALEEKRQTFIEGFTGISDWHPGEAAAFFDKHATENALCRESDIIFEEATRYRSWFPRLAIATFLYRVEDGLLYLLEE